ncbi:MAG: 1,4-alpha-glucan branching enzyme, partial [Lachnospiraceae bacterium]|nr:1,4-alpha-glucan branching enzyme [Lachnospiraceae bacterium]
MNNKLYKLMNWPEIEGVIFAECDDPHSILGPHKSGNNTLLQCYFPKAKEIKVNWENETGENLSTQMEMADEEGFFAVLLPVKNLKKYNYDVTYENETVKNIPDPYFVKTLFDKKDAVKFTNGIHYEIYDHLGAHPLTVEGISGVYFAVWAPNALAVSVVGDFNNWDRHVHQMRRIKDVGIFELFVPGAKKGQNYKYEILVKGGITQLKADPYAFESQLRPENASVITDLTEFKWEDKEFIDKRGEFQANDKAISIYEMHLNSFMEKEDFANYKEIAKKLIPYVKKMG